MSGRSGAAPESYFFDEGFWLSALPAADRESLLDRPSESVFEALVAAAAEVSFCGDLRCASALPAADLDFAEVSLLASVFDALVAAGFEVDSFLAMTLSVSRGAPIALDRANRD